MQQATRIYLGNCPNCGGLAIFTSVWEQGKDNMLTVIDCTDNECQVAAQVNAKQASGQPRHLMAMYKVAGLQPQPGPVYTVSENCTLE